MAVVVVNQDTNPILHSAPRARAIAGERGNGRPLDQYSESYQKRLRGSFATGDGPNVQTNKDGTSWG